MNPIIAYGLVERAWPWRLRGPGNAQHPTNGLLFPGPTYRQNQAGGETPTTTTTPSPGIELGYFSMHNRAGGSIFAGMAVRIPNVLWRAGQWINATTTYVEDTADAQSATGDDFPLEAAATTNSNGFVISCAVPFNAVSLDIGTGNGGAGATRTMFHSDRAGTAWTTMAANSLYVTLPAVTPVTGTTVANEALIVWDVPEDWGAVSTTSAAIGTGVPQGMYAINMRATTAPTTAASALSLSIYRMYFLTEALADNGTFEFVPGGLGAYMAPEGDALVPMFSTADEGNRITVMVRPRG